MHRLRLALALSLVSALSLAGCASTAKTHDSRERSRRTGSVIFLHPDGTSSANLAALRMLDVGPDGELHWDRLPAMALYRGHMRNSLTASSNGGATAHAYGVRPYYNAFGMTGGDDPRPLVDDRGQSLSVARQALRHGLSVGLVQSGSAIEPGTACFVTAAEARGMYDQIAAQLVASGAQVLLSGGERHFLPRGTRGVHGPGTRGDDRNLIEEARDAGYRVVYTLEQLRAVPDDAEKVLGLFASDHTFHDQTEEQLAERGLPLYDPDAPTLAQMTEAALRILSAKGRRFLLVVEEEGTDNFGNKNNARGFFEAARRADDAIGLCRDYLEAHPDTLLLTAADSDGGGMRVIGYRAGRAPERVGKSNGNGAPIDGIRGSQTPPFTAAPDRFGNRLPFTVAWASYTDVSGGVLVRAAGLHSDRVHGNLDNTDLTDLMRWTLFGTSPP